MLVIRIEGPNGRGIFRQNISDNDYYYDNMYDESLALPNLDVIDIDAYWRHGSFLTPRQDDIDMTLHEKQWFCGYKSVEQLKQWLLPKEIVKLINAGYTVFLLEVSEYQIGKKYQIAYTKESIIDKTNINSLFL